jgi:tetratricopeptide (TPR) repeat protein
VWTWLSLCVLLVTACRQAPALPPPDPVALGQIDPAVRSLIDESTASVNAQPGDAARWDRLAMAYEANGFLVQAAQSYDAAVTLDPRTPQPLYRRALLRARRGDADAALADLDRVIALAPSYVPARWRQGLWLLDRGDTAEAEAAFQYAAQAAPADPAGTIGLALVHLAKREDAEAAAVLERTLAAEPGQRYAQHLLGTAYQRLGRDAEARFALTVGASGQPEWNDPWSDEVSPYRRGFAAMLKEATRLAQDRRFDDSIAILSRLVEQRQADTALRVYLGGIHASAGHIGEAAAILDPVLASDPSNFDATMHLATGYLFTGALDKAASYAARALSLRPSNADAAKLQGVVDWQQGRLQRAQTAFDAAATADPRDPMPHLWTGMILGQQQRYVDARRRFEEALARNPLLGDALLGVADTYAATGNFADAQTALKRAEQAEPSNPRLAAARERIDAASARARP